jgi:hypothetical protein
VPTISGRDQLFGDDLGGVEDVEIEAVGEVLVEHLQAQVPLRAVAGLQRLPQVAAVVVGVRAVDLHGLVPQDGLQALARFPVELDEGRLAASAFTSRKVWTPNPSIVRNDRGIVRSDICHMIMCIDSGVSEM